MCLPRECPMILLDVEWGCLVGSSQGPPFLPFFKMGLMFSFFHLLGICLTAKTSWIWLRISWASQHQPVPLGPWDTSHWVPWTYVQVSQVVLNLEWRELQSTASALRFRELRDVGREITIESWGEKLLNSSAFFISVVTSSHVLFIERRYVYFNLPFSSQCSCRTVHFLLTL